MNTKFVSVMSAVAVSVSAVPTATIANVPLAAGVTTASGSSSVLSEHDRLFRLFKQSDEASLKRNPLDGIYRGDLRYAGQYGDYITDEYFAAERTAAEADLDALHAIDRSRLNATDQIAYDVFEYATNDKLRGLQPNILALTAVLPMNHFFGAHTSYPTFASGQGAAPFKTQADYENNLKRHDGFVAFMDRAIGRFRQGKKNGVVDTKMTVRNMIEQLNAQLAQEPDESPYFGPVKLFPDGIGGSDRDRLTRQYRTMISDKIYPALTRMRDFLASEYLPHAREGHGLVHMQGGDRLYHYLVQSTTTLPLTPKEVHEQGLREVARILGDMEKVRHEVGFDGTLQQFFDYLRNDPKFKKETREALTQGYYDIGKTVDAKLSPYFAAFPKSKLDIRPYEPFREKFEAGGSYDEGAADGSRPGTFYFNAYDLPSRTTPGMTTLYLHEGAPGHHFQIMLARENDALPAFMRFEDSTAFAEGWALYAETLGYEMGLFEDPYQRFGTLSDEMIRAMRLVVDTGIHAMGWNREKAIQYMLANSDMGETDATAEVERYIAVPSQALAYKIGAMTIQRLRRKAETELGPKFDIRDFHAQVLMTGSLPLAILEQKIERWIAATKVD